MDSDELALRLRKFQENPRKSFVDDLVRDVLRHVSGLEVQIEECKNEIEGLEARMKEMDGEIADAVHPVLDLVERPCGTLHASLPPSPAAERALIALHNAVGRRL
jgi:hypothetical protein